MQQFHAYLDRCDRCRQQPFNLCPQGASLLEDAAVRATTPPRHRLGVDARLGAVEGDTEEHELGYGHGV